MLRSVLLTDVSARSRRAGLRAVASAGAPFQWAAIFPKKAVRFISGTAHLKFYNNETDSNAHELPCKVLCSSCNSPLADEGRNMWLAFPTQFHFPGKQVPDSFAISCHIFYGQRAANLRMQDGKPKWQGHKENSELLPD